jgi:hypothetical protein
MGNALINFTTAGFDETGTHAKSEAYAVLLVAPIPEPHPSNSLGASH